MKMRPPHPAVLALASAAIALAGAQAAAVEKRPNLVLFLADDLGWQDSSVPFAAEETPLNGRYRTPHMEALAATGMKFTQAYACPVCSPSRISLMTGLSAARHRVTNWTLRKDAATDRDHPRLVFPLWNVNGLSPVAGVDRTVHARTLPMFLRDAGYRTIHAGKAHFGAVGTPGADPRNLGFEINIGGHAAGGPGSFLGTQNFSAAWRKGDAIWDVPGLGAYHDKDIFLTEALTIEANRAVDAAVADGKPFYLYMAHYAVHVPFAEDARFIQRYRDARLDETEAMYAAMIEGMDKSLGDVLANIERHGLSRDTIVLFMSDNGGLSASGRGGEPHTHNRPLSSGKGSAHEGGIRVPMIVRWPGITRPGSACPQPVIIEDFFPTILELAGVTGAAAPIDGISFVPMLRGEPPSQPDRSLFWHFPNNWGPKGPGIGAFSAIRRGDWKLIYYHDPERPEPFEMFNLADDLGERHNLAAQRPGIRSDLARALAEFLAAAGAQMPARKDSGKLIPLPE